MRGRIKKKKIADQEQHYQEHVQTEYLCQLCLRPTTKAQRDKHHLIPKSRGGVETVILHKLFPTFIALDTYQLVVAFIRLAFSISESDSAASTFSH